MGTIFGIIVLVVNILAIVEVVKSSKSTGLKVVWSLFIFFVPVVGVLVYIIIGRKK